MRNPWRFAFEPHLAGDRLLFDRTDEGRFCVHTLEFAMALYAWGRRVPDREAVLRLLPPEAFAEYESDAQIVWTARCADDEVDSLLDWWTLARRHGHEPRSAFLVAEFANRCRDAGRRRAALLALARENRGACEAREPLGVSIFCVATNALATDLAHEGPPVEPGFADARAAVALLRDRLDRIGGGDVSRFIDARGGAELHLGPLFWIESQGAETCDRLLEAASHPYMRYQALSRLAKVAPGDRIDIWRGLLAQQAGEFEVHAFCTWLDPMQRDELIPYFEDCSEAPTTGWTRFAAAAIAFQAYLARTPRDEALRLAEMDLPAWQQRQLDAFLYAPAPFRPAPLFAPDQAAEGDPRLYDPLSPRGL
jgi:hypothetical protein